MKKSFLTLVTCVSLSGIFCCAQSTPVGEGASLTVSSTENGAIQNLIDDSIDVRELESIAKEHLSRQQWDVAKSALERAVALGSERATTYRLLGKLYFETGEKDLAKNALDQAMTLGPEEEDLYPLLVDLATQYDMTDWLRPYLEKGASLRDKDSFIYYQLGHLYLGQYAFDQAESVLKKAYELDDTQYRALIDLAEVYRHLANREQFVETLDILYENHRGEDGVEVTLGNHWMKLADWKNLYKLRTADDYRVAITDPESQLAQAIKWIQEEAFYKGFRLLESLLYENSENPVALYNIGNLLCRFNNFDEGIKAFQILGQMAPNDPRPFFGIAKAAWETKQYDLGFPAIQWADELIQKDPTFDFLKAGVEALYVQFLNQQF